MSFKTFCSLLATAGLLSFASLPAHSAGRIAFVSDRNGEIDLYAMDGDGGNLSQLTTSTGIEDRNPEWTADGQKIAYTRGGAIWSVKSDGTGATQIADNTSNKVGPFWFPDASKLLFSAFGGFDVDIFSMNADGSNITRIINNTYGDYGVRINPAGTKVVFATFPAPSIPQVYTANIDGSGQVQLPGAGGNSHGAWSPDGTKLVYRSDRDGNDEIYVMNADGSNQVRLTFNPARDWLPKFSPDGTQIAFASFRDGQSEIYVMNADGSNQTRITTNAGEDSEPAWGTFVPAGSPAISVNDVDVAEGNSGTRAATFTFTLSAASALPVTFTVRTADSSATAPTDYVAQPATTLTFAPGELSKTLTVPVVGDISNEPTEIFTLQTYGAQNGYVVRPYATCTITDATDPLPTVSVGNASVVEGTGGTTNLNFPITLSAPSGYTVTVTAATTGGTGANPATPGTDYTEVVGGTVTFAPGSTSAVLPVAVAGDAIVEPDETFGVTISSPVNAVLGTSSATGTILNGDLPVVSITSNGVTEGNSGTAGPVTTTVPFTIALSQTYTSDVTFDYFTSDISATAGTDYVAATGSGMIPAGQLSTVVHVTVTGDNLLEPDETFALNLKNLVNATGPLTGVPLRNAGNGHYYEAYNTFTNFNTARALAASRYLAGARGHLVTITSAEEQSFITSSFAPTFHWMGALQPAGSVEPAGGWTWITGEPFVYTNYYPGRPNNAGITESNVEDALVFYVGSQWEDASSNGNFKAIFEYDVSPNVERPALPGTSTIFNDDPLPSLSVVGGTGKETTGATSTVNITVKLSGPSYTQVAVNYGTASGSALADVDFSATGGTLTFAPGETSKTISLSVLDDAVLEPTEFFTVNLSSAANATIESSSAQVSILDNDSPPPVNTSLTPAGARDNIGSTRTLSAVYTQSNGANAITNVRLLANASLTAANGLVGSYDRVTNKLYLYNDAGTALLGGFAPGSANTITNSQGSLNCAATTVSLSGTTLTVNWNFTAGSAFTGGKNLYMLVTSNPGGTTGWDQMGTWTLASAAPQNTSVTPVTPASAVGGTQQLSAVYTDANGATDIQSARILVNGNLSGAQGLVGYFDRPSNKLYLYNDTGTALLGGFAPGSANTISNSQGSLNCAATTVSQVGTSLTVNWSFSPAFSGVKNVYLLVADGTRLQAGWDQKATWTISAGNIAPLNSSVSPNAGSSVAGTSQMVTSVYTDANGAGDIKSARILINGSLGAANGLIGYYDRPSNKLYLYNDAGNVQLGGFAPGSANVITNSQGSLDCAATTVVQSGNTLTINWHFTPATGFVGIKKLYLLVTDGGNVSAGWDQKGTWTISAPALPIAASLAPSGEAN